MGGAGILHAPSLVSPGLRCVAGPTRFYGVHPQSCLSTQAWLFLTCPHTVTNGQFPTTSFPPPTLALSKRKIPTAGAFLSQRPGGRYPWRPRPCFQKELEGPLQVEAAESPSSSFRNLLFLRHHPQLPSPPPATLGAEMGVHSQQALTFQSSSSLLICWAVICRARSCSCSEGILTSQDRKQRSWIRGCHCELSQLMSLRLL